VTIKTTYIKATFTPASRSIPHESISFYDAITSALLLSEGVPEFEPSTDPASKPGESIYTVQQSWSADADEGLYGGGEFQNGFVDFRGAAIEMVQFNTEAAVPFFSSTKGYGLLWDNNAWTYLNRPTSPPLIFKPQPIAPRGPIGALLHHDPSEAIRLC
jgi:alpha-D-xyloside xylohydrolase